MLLCLDFQVALCPPPPHSQDSILFRYSLSSRQSGECRRTRRSFSFQVFNITPPCLAPFTPKHLSHSSQNVKLKNIFPLFVSQCRGRRWGCTSALSQNCRQQVIVVVVFLLYYTCNTLVITSSTYRCLQESQLVFHLLYSKLKFHKWTCQSSV